MIYHFKMTLKSIILLALGLVVVVVAILFPFFPLLRFWFDAYFDSRCPPELFGFFIALPLFGVAAVSGGISWIILKLTTHSLGSVVISTVSGRAKWLWFIASIVFLGIAVASIVAADAVMDC